jgi:hypothetical protein
MLAEKTSARAGGGRRGFYWLALFALLLALAAFVAWRSNALKALDDDDARAGAQAPAATAAASAGAVTLDADDQERGRIISVEPKEISYQERVRAYGIVLPLVRLTTLYNSASAAAQQLKSAEAKLSASHVANLRAQNLLKVAPSAVAQAEAAEAAEKIDAAAVEAAKDQIEAFGNVAAQDWGPALGPAVAARSPLAEDLVRRKSALAQLTLQPGAVAEPPARIELTFASGETAEAELVSPATQTDPKLAGPSYFYVLPAAPAALAGATVTASMPKGEAKPSVVLPSSAIVWQSGKPWIYVKAAADRYERKPLDDDAVPAADGGYIVPADDWPQGQSIVVEGAQALATEESKSRKRPDEDND